MLRIMPIKCKEHPFEQKIGVCASCLRERLLDLEAAQTRRRLSEEKLREDLSHPPLVFPRSVSPYVARRRSADLEGQIFPRENLRFFSTPQAGPALGPSKNSGFFTAIFNGESRSKVSVENRGSSKISWFSALIPGRRKKKQLEREAIRWTPPVRSSAAVKVAYPSPPARPSVRRDNEGESSEMARGAFAGHYRRQRTVGGDLAAQLRHNRTTKIAELGKFR